MTALFASGLIGLAVAAAAGFISAGPGWTRGLPYMLGAAGSACLAAAGGFALSGRTVTLNVAGWLGRPIGPGQSAGLAVDRLS